MSPKTQKMIGDIKQAFVLPILFIVGQLMAQLPPQTDSRHYDIITAVSADRIEGDIRKLAGFETKINC